MFSDDFYMMLFCSFGGGKSEGSINLGWLAIPIWSDIPAWAEKPGVTS